MDLIAIGTFFQSLGLPVAMLAVMVYLVFKIQGDSNKSETRTDGIINKQLEISGKQADILDKQTNLMVQLDTKSEKSILVVNEGFARMDEQHKLTTKNVDELREQFKLLLPVVEKVSKTLDQNETNVDDLRTNVGQLRSEVKVMGETVMNIITILNSMKGTTNAVEVVDIGYSIDADTNPTGTPNTIA